MGCCILFHFYIKPQHLHSRFDLINVVSYSISTSNHNITMTFKLSLKVVSYSISTSNHNVLLMTIFLLPVVSYSISTSNHNSCNGCFSSATVVSYSISTSNHNQRNLDYSGMPVVSYSISTSNHNVGSIVSSGVGLYLIPFLHQTTTVGMFTTFPRSCILFHFYIKPQLSHNGDKDKTVVSYSISTSNHNKDAMTYNTKLLYLIPFLHQTTTERLRR